jgi:hypothetical protein
MDFDDFASFVMGVLMCIIGWHLLHNPGYLSWRLGAVDFGSFHWVIGAMLVGVGLVAVLNPIHKFYRGRHRN